MKLYTTAEIAEEAGVARSTAWRAIHRAGVGKKVGTVCFVEGERNKAKVLAEIRGRVGNPNFKKKTRGRGR